MADNKDQSLEDIIADAMKKKHEKETKAENTKESNDTVSAPDTESYKFTYPDDNEHHEHHHKKTSGHSKNKKGKKKMSAKKKGLIIALVVVGIILGIVIFIAAAIHHYISKMNLVDPSHKDYIVDSINIDDKTDKPNSPDDMIKSLDERIKANLNREGLMESDNVMNILLMGTDARENNERGRSDSMILISINKETKKIIMTSFLRDMYVAIPGIGNSRLNHAYSYGGADLAVETVEKNFKIKINRYAQINFASFVELVDDVGGVEIDISEDEIQYLNNYLNGINKLEGGTPTEKLTSAGKQKLDGRQALAYSRIRYVGTDFGRTERQRTVLTKVFEKAKGMSLSEIDDLADKLLPLVTTNLTENEIFSLIIKSPSYLNYNLNSCRVPDDDTWENMVIDSMDVLGIDFDKNQKYLFKNIYNIK